MLVELVQDHGGHGTLPELDDDPDPFLVRFVPDVRDPLDLLLLDEVCDLLNEAGLVHLERDLGDQDGGGLLLVGDLGNTADHALPPARLVRLTDPGCSHDNPARGKVGGREDGKEFLDRNGRVVEVGGDRPARLPEVVGEHVRRHADGNPARAVHEEVRDLRREHERLLEGLVEVGGKRHRLLLQVLQELLGGTGEPDLGVSHRSGRITVDGAEVPLAIDEGSPVGEVLGHLHEGVIDGCVPVGVILAHHFPDNTGRLLVGLVARIAHLPHGEEGTSVDGLEAVARIGDCPPDDHGHRVVDVRDPHLVLDLDRHPSVRYQGSSPPSRPGG